MTDQLQEMTAEIVSGFVAANVITAAELPALIKSVYLALSTLGQAEPAKEPAGPEKPTPAQIRKSITEHGLVSFIDGKPYKTLKRHLSGHGLTVAEYRERYGLPKDYPTTSPAYSAMRSTMAKQIGLGRKAGQTKQVMAAAKAPRAKKTSTRTTKA